MKNDKADKNGENEAAEIEDSISEKANARKRARTISFSIIISLITALLATAVTNVFVYKYNTTMYPSRYEDARLVEKIENELSEGKNRFVVTQIEKTDLHGLDHISMIACGYLDTEQGRPYAKLAIYEKPTEDYTSVLKLSPISTQSLTILEKIAFQT